MSVTIFNTPIVTPILRGLAAVLRGLTGWRAEGAVPDVPKLVVAVAPHTSNWDVPVGIILCLKLRISPSWFVKSSFFRFPFGGLCRWLGAVPVERTRATNAVSHAVRALRDRDRVMLAFTPEGTRAASRYWKTGFYHIAHSAGVPIALCYLDYSRKRGGLGPLFWPTGDIYKDMEKIREHYAPFRGLYPELQGPVEVPPPEPARKSSKD
jgi:1-acyl-sn-glycerol-3-phosphate acyltransferase